MGKDCRGGAEPLLLLAAALAAQLGEGKNAKELFELGKFLNLVKENLYLLADRRLSWPEPIRRAERKLAGGLPAAKEDKKERD